jgi:hypothetical protein
MCLILACAAPAAEYHVGPGQALTTIGAVPWHTLAGGDTVSIHWRSEPYREKWVICRRGTAGAPIRVLGVTNAAGARPVISGENAVTPAPLNFWNESRGLVKIGGANTPADTLPAHIVIAHLEFRSARPPFTFTDDGGNSQSYVNNAAAVYVEKGHDLVVRNCILHDSGNGLFIGPFEGATSNILVEACHLHSNGNVGSIYEHNNYTEADGIVFQCNRFGPLRAGCNGNNLKDRSAGCVIRYNWLEGGNRQLDLVDSEYFYTRPSYTATYVYGNVLLEHTNDGNSQIVHYGGDNTETYYRKGALHFFNNTVISKRVGNTTLLRLSSNDEYADCRNNIIWVSDSGDHLALLDENGRLRMAPTWLSTNFVVSHQSPFNGTVSYGGGLQQGAAPGFLDADADDYSLQPGSPCIAAGTGTAQPIAWQYSLHQAGVPRSDGGADLGAFALVPEPTSLGLVGLVALCSFCLRSAIA